MPTYASEHTQLLFHIYAISPFIPQFEKLYEGSAAAQWTGS